MTSDQCICLIAIIASGSEIIRCIMSEKGVDSAPANTKNDFSRSIHFQNKQTAVAWRDIGGSSRRLVGLLYF